MFSVGQGFIFLVICLIIGVISSMGTDFVLLLDLDVSLRPTAVRGIVGAH